MRNIAVIFAGGTGQRMNTKTRPKQFLELHGKPILIYTLEVFERCRVIDDIVLVMLQEWIPFTEELLDKYRIKKVRKIVPGGTTGQESIFNGIKCAIKIDESCNVFIHDGVRPIIDSDTIEACAQSIKKYGNAITTSPAQETIAIIAENGEVGRILPRKQCLIAKAPQCFHGMDIYECHIKARNEGKLDFIDSASLMQYYGFTLHTVEGPIENMKITTPGDFYIFRAIIDAQENSQIFG